MQDFSILHIISKALFAQKKLSFCYYNFIKYVWRSGSGFYSVHKFLKTKFRVSYLQKYNPFSIKKLECLKELVHVIVSSKPTFGKCFC